jgi:predicted helicase
VGNSIATAGRELADLHLNYDQRTPSLLEHRETAPRLRYDVDDRMRWGKDKTSLVVNDSLTLEGIPAEAHEYRIGNRSALDWIVEQYRVTEDSRSEIRSDPNQPEDAHYIVNLVDQVAQVSVETMEVIKGLPADFTG